MLQYRLKGFYILTGHFKLDYSVIDSDKLSLIKNECLQSRPRWTYTYLISYCNASGQMLKRILRYSQTTMSEVLLDIFYNLIQKVLILEILLKGKHLRNLCFSQKKCKILSI